MSHDARCWGKENCTLTHPVAAKHIHPLRLRGESCSQYPDRAVRREAHGTAEEGWQDVWPPGRFSPRYTRHYSAEATLLNNVSGQWSIVSAAPVGTVGGRDPLPRFNDRGPGCATPIWCQHGNGIGLCRNERQPPVGGHCPRVVRCVRWRFVRPAGNRERGHRKAADFADRITHPGRHQPAHDTDGICFPAHRTVYMPQRISVQREVRTPVLDGSLQRDSGAKLSVPGDPLQHASPR